MSTHQVLYRKYRSKAMSEIVGQDHIVNTLENALKSGKISHAYLFTGPRGVGKTSVARILAHEVNDIKYDEKPQLDIIEIDAASNRRIEEVRDLREKVHIAPSSLKFKVYIIDEVHMLTREAFNALLKTLEEPPAHIIFILATTESHKLPETIISRTQRFQFKPISDETATKHLRSIAVKEKIDIDDEAIRLLAAHGNGSFRDSINLLDQVRHGSKKITAKDVSTMLGMASDSLVQDIATATLNGDTDELSKQFDQIRSQGMNVPQLSKQISLWFRNYLLSTSNISDEIFDKLTVLISVPSSNQPDVAFELALLNIALTTSKTAETQKYSIPLKVASQSELKATPKSIAKKRVDSSKTFSEADWDKVLNGIKKENNTLYGVLRMAKINVNDNRLVLAFGFPFHQKRAQDTHAQQLLKSLLSEYLNLDMEIESVLDESLKIDKSASKAKAATLETVSNIFDGAELLES